MYMEPGEAQSIEDCSPEKKHKVAVTCTIRHCVVLQQVLQKQPDFLHPNG